MLISAERTVLFLKKRMISIVILSALVLMAASVTLVQAEQQRLSAKLIRLHVVANSDSAHDQAVKLEVRDAVSVAAKALLDGAEDPRAALAGRLDAVADAADAAREVTVADTAADAETGCATTGAAVPPLRRLHPNRLPSRLRRRTPRRLQPRQQLRRPSAAAIAEADVIAAEGTSPEHRRPEAHSLRAATRSRPDVAAFGGGSGCVGARIGLEKAGGAGRRGRSSSEKSGQGPRP